MSILTIDELRPLARVTGTAQDAVLAEYEAGAVDFLSARTHRYFGVPLAWTRQHEGDGTHTLWLEELMTPNEVRPTTIIERSEPAGTDVVITAADSDGFVIRGDTLSKLVRKAGGRWTWGYEYEITYTRGFKPENVPPRVRDAVGKIFAYYFERRIPVPKVGEVFTADLPHHLTSLIGTLERKLV